MTLAALGVLPTGHHGFAEFGAGRDIDGQASAYGLAGWQMTPALAAFAGLSMVQDGQLVGNAGLRWTF